MALVVRYRTIDRSADNSTSSPKSTPDLYGYTVVCLGRGRPAARLQLLYV